jgi:nucleoside-diphosphate-sugar epimerase
MAEANVLGTILKQLHKEGPVQIFDATPVRDFLWIEDAARGLADMVAGQTAGIFNVGSGAGVSILELATEVLRATGQSGRPVESTHPGNRFSELVLDITQTGAVFGWRPAVTLVEGIATLVKMKIAKD